jgi:hypothetical protein
LARVSPEIHSASSAVTTREPRAPVQALRSAVTYSLNSGFVARTYLEFDHR